MSNSQKLQQRRLGPFTVVKSVTNITYEIQNDKDPSIIEIVHRNQLVEFYPREESLPAMIKKYVPHDQGHDYFHERFLERRIDKLNGFTSLPIPKRPLHSAPAITSHKRDSATSFDSEVFTSTFLANLTF